MFEKKSTQQMKEKCEFNRNEWNKMIEKFEIQKN